MTVIHICTRLQRKKVAQDHMKSLGIESKKWRRSACDKKVPKSRDID